MKKLQILVPQYKETDEIVRPLLDSIALQQGVDLDDVGVIIVRDGDGPELSEDLLHGYPFKIQYHKRAHRGVSATRNAALDLAVADYVMFCDADDMFLSSVALWVLFREMPFDAFSSLFVEEGRDSSGKPVFMNRAEDRTFVHGKVYRRKYLTEQGIRWNEALTIHEDSYFNILAQACTKEFKYCSTPLYLWKYRADSICRQDPKYLLKTYKELIKSNGALINELIRRAQWDTAKYWVAYMVFDTFYLLQHADWQKEENKEHRDATERVFAEWLQEHGARWDAIPEKEKMTVSTGLRARHYTEGMGLETTTVADWIKHIRSL